MGYFQGEGWNPAGHTVEAQAHRTVGSASCTAYSQLILHQQNAFGGFHNSTSVVTTRASSGTRSYIHSLFSRTMRYVPTNHPSSHFTSLHNGHSVFLGMSLPQKGHDGLRLKASSSQTVRVPSGAVSIVTISPLTQILYAIQRDFFPDCETTFQSELTTMTRPSQASFAAQKRFPSTVLDNAVGTALFHSGCS